MRPKAWSLALFAAAMLAFVGSAGAVDGTIEINQAKVNAAGGFPYIIGAGGSGGSGSYRLTGNLTVPAGTNGINVTANNVTIDLNGFSIVGPGSSSNATGIDAPSSSGITVENGTVTGFGGLGNGISVTGAIIRNVHADKNGTGISGGNNAVIEGCTANNSTSSGSSAINCSGACTVSGNTVSGNANVGILCGGNGCTISGNTADANASIGIWCDGSGCLISGNTVVGNSTGIVAIDGTTGYRGNVLKNTTDHSAAGTSLGNNLCSGTVC